VVEGALVAAAVGAVFLAAWSWGAGGAVRGQVTRTVVRAERADVYYVTTEGAGGRIKVFCNRIGRPSAGPEGAPAFRAVPGWTWKFERKQTIGPTLVSPSEWGPLVWERRVWKDGPWDRARSSIVLPVWLPVAAAGVWPAMALVVRVLRRRRAGDLGVCTACGYDLRATPGRCPECGTRPGEV
jgi:hypothetical protein